MRIATLLASAVVIGMTAGTADAKRPLREIPEIWTPLFYIAVADEIRKKCPSISGRLFKGMNDLRRLKDYANSLGYSDKEIEDFVESESERARMTERGEDYLAQYGADRDKPETLCVLGRAEIERNSAIGVYLKAN